MSRLEQQFKDLRIITGTDTFIDHTTSLYALNTSRSTRSVNPLYQTNTSSGISQSYMLLTSPNRNRSTQNLQLSVPKATSPLSKGNSSKLKKHISFINNSFNYPQSSLIKHHTRSITTTTTPSSNVGCCVNCTNVITSYKNRPPVNVDNNKFEFSARTYMMYSPISRAIPCQPLFKAAKTKNAFALFKPSSTTTNTNNTHNTHNIKNMFNHSARHSYLNSNTSSKRKETLINTSIYADKIKHQLKHGSYHEPSTSDNDVGVFAKELKAWSNKKESEWKQIHLY